MKILTRYIVVILLLSVAVGCQKETKPEEQPLDGPYKGLDVIPYYKKGSFDFDTEAAMKVTEEEALEEEKRKASIEKRAREAYQGQEGSATPVAYQAQPAGTTTTQAGVQIPDPWVAPPQRDTASLPLAVTGLPVDKYGYTDWVASQREALIIPRDSIIEGEDIGMTFDKEIIFKINDPLMADVLYSHKLHTDLLSCDSCHPEVFIPAQGSNRFTMNDIWSGKGCGKCHGKVAFQPKGFENCKRCHSLSRTGG